MMKSSEGPLVIIKARNDGDSDKICGHAKDEKEILNIFR
jgi:hypothetical protein